MCDGSQGYRQTLLSLLETIGSRELQEEYEERVPIASVPAELVCGWFDDDYHPGSGLFRAAFSEREARVLADFDEVFRREVESISGAAEVRELWARPGWVRVSAAAAMASGLIVASALGEET